jgi:hypothetical protein
MSSSTRKGIRCVIWSLLALCAALDELLAEGAISGLGDVAYVDAEGNWEFPRAEPKLWLPIAGFILLQGLLVFALLRLREPARNPPSVFRGESESPRRI